MSLGFSMMWNIIIKISTCNHASSFPFTAVNWNTPKLVWNHFCSLIHVSSLRALQGNVTVPGANTTTWCYKWVHWLRFSGLNMLISYWILGESAHLNKRLAWFVCLTDFPESLCFLVHLLLNWLLWIIAGSMLLSLGGFFCTLLELYSVIFTCDWLWNAAVCTDLYNETTTPHEPFTKHGALLKWLGLWWAIFSSSSWFLLHSLTWAKMFQSKCELSLLFWETDRQVTGVYTSVGSLCRPVWDDGC